MGGRRNKRNHLSGITNGRSALQDEFHGMNDGLYLVRSRKATEWTALDCSTTPHLESSEISPSSQTEKRKGEADHVLTLLIKLNPHQRVIKSEEKAISQSVCEVVLNSFSQEIFLLSADRSIKSRLFLSQPRPLNLRPIIEPLKQKVALKCGNETAIQIETTRGCK